jgi:hypothetical protein
MMLLMLKTWITSTRTWQAPGEKLDGQVFVGQYLDFGGADFASGQLFCGASGAISIVIRLQKCFRLCSDQYFTQLAQRNWGSDNYTGSVFDARYMIDR